MTTSCTGSPALPTVAVHIYDRLTTSNREGLRRRLEACSAFARRQGWDIAGWYVDSGVDAFRFDDRPALERLFASMAAREGSRRLLVYDWSRLSNDATWQAEFLRRARRNGGTTSTVMSGDDDPGTRPGRLRALGYTA